MNPRTDEPIMDKLKFTKKPNENTWIATGPHGRGVGNSKTTAAQDYYANKRYTRRTNIGPQKQRRS